MPFSRRRRLPKPLRSKLRRLLLPRKPRRLPLRRPQPRRSPDPSQRLPRQKLLRNRTQARSGPRRHPQLYVIALSLRVYAFADPSYQAPAIVETKTVLGKTKSGRVTKGPAAASNPASKKSKVVKKSASEAKKATPKKSATPKSKATPTAA